MNAKEILKQTTYIALLEVIMVILMFAILILLKILGIEGGNLTKTIPFLSIILCLFISYLIIDKGRINLGINKVNILVVILFIVIAILPALFDRSFFQILLNREINYAWLGYYLLVALAEELYFRAYIRFKLGRFGKSYWIITSSIGFSAIHFISSEELSIFFFLLIFLFGIIFAVSYGFLESILPLIAFHTVWNFMTDLSDHYSNMLIVFGIWIMMILTSLFIRMLKRHRYRANDIGS